MRQTIKAQINYAALILQGMGYSGECIIMADTVPPQAEVPAGCGGVENRLSNLSAGAADFSPVTDRRELMRLAVGHLYEQSPSTQTGVPLPSGAPFGAIRIDKDACTFCMACAQVCPTEALAGGSDRPQLNLIEARCIQCGLCLRACPEKAIALDPRFVYERQISERQQVLNREASFNCICCGKPFAAARLVERLETRLTGHWMYRSPEERRRLKMCRDCRLQDIFSRQHSREVR
jgi:ferredoxin